MSPTPRALIIEHHRAARERLCAMLRDSGVEIVGVFDDAAATAASTPAAADVVFVCLPSRNGEFNRLEQPAARPAMVVVAPDPGLAARAFELDALDYLVKPVAAERLSVTLRRLRRRLDERTAAEIGRRVLEMAADPGSDRGIERLAITRRGRIVSLPVAEIDWIEAVGNDLRLHAGPESHLTRGTIADIERRLRGSGFLRVHRSHIVNAARVSAVHGNRDGGIVVLRDGTEVRYSRSYRQRLRPLIGPESEHR